MLPVDEEVDVDGRVVLGDGRLAGDLDELLAHVHLHRPVDDGDEEASPGPLTMLGAGLAQAEDHEPLVLVDDAHGQIGQHDDHDEDQDERADGHGVEPREPPGHRWSGSTMSTRPSWPTIRTGVPRSSLRPSALRAVHSSPAA